MINELPAWMIPTVFGLFGLCIGSFLNVVIYRMPLGIPVNNPSRSYCPTCKTPIPWYLNIPVISWLMLRGKSACCGKAISPRYCLVEALTGGLFAWIGGIYGADSPAAAALLCLWLTMAICVIFIDAEHLIVFRRQTIIGALAAVGAGWFYPFIYVDQEVMSGADAVKAAALGGLAGYLLIRVIIETGKLLFGSWQAHYDAPAPWHLKEPATDMDEMELVIHDQSYGWSMLFHRESDKALFSGGRLLINGEQAATGDFYLYPDRIETADGQVFKLEEIKSAGGTLTNIHAKREAMGAGDAWIMMMIGCMGGWQATVFCIFIGSLLGIAQALISRLGFGKNMPFGPALLSAAIIWLLGGKQLWLMYLEFINL